MTQKRVTSVADPWPVELAQQLTAFHTGCQPHHAQLAAHIASLAGTVMPEQRTQLLARIGETLAATATNAATQNTSNNNNNSKTKPDAAATTATPASTPAAATVVVVDHATRVELLRGVLLPLLFESRVRYLHKSALNLIVRANAKNNATTTSSSKLGLDEGATVIPELIKFATAFVRKALQPQQQQQRAETAAATTTTTTAEEHWLRVANDVDAVFIMLMPALPTAFDSLVRPLLQILRNISEILIVPHLAASTAATTPTHAARTTREVMTETQLAQLRFACRVVTTVFHKFSRHFREECAATVANGSSNNNNSNNNNHSDLQQNCYHLAGASALMLSCQENFPKDLLNTAGLLVATVFECVTTKTTDSAEILAICFDAATSLPQQRQQPQVSVQQRGFAFHQLLLLSSSAAAFSSVGQPKQQHAATILSGICLTGAFSLLRGFVSHFVGMNSSADPATKQRARLVFASPAAASQQQQQQEGVSKSSFAVRCFEFSAHWADRVDEPEGRFLAIQTLDSIVRCYQEVLYKREGASDDHVSASVQRDAATVLDGISEKLLSLWDDPTLSVSGPLFETFDRIIQCKAAAASGNNNNNSHSNFLITTTTDLLRGQHHERRGKWQVLSALFPRMSLHDINTALSPLVANNNSNINNNAISTFLVPILCACSTNNKCNSLCGDVAITLIEKLLGGSGSNNHSGLDEAQNQVIVPLLQHCVDFFLMQIEKQETQQRTSNVSDTAHLFDPSHEAKTRINCVVTHLLAPTFRSTKIGPQRAFQLVVRSALNLRRIVYSQPTVAATMMRARIDTAFEWILTFAAWRARGSDLDFFAALEAGGGDGVAEVCEGFCWFLDRALFSPESDVRSAAVEVLTLRTKSLAVPLTEEQVTMFFEFCHRNWVTGETAFRNGLITLLKKVLSRLVDTAKHTQWREQVLGNNNNNNNNNTSTPEPPLATPVADRLAKLDSWQRYVFMIVSALHGVQQRIAATTDLVHFSADRAMNNMIVFGEVQDCMLQFIGSTASSDSSSSSDNNRKLPTSVLGEIERVSKSLDERVAAQEEQQQQQGGAVNAAASAFPLHETRWPKIVAALSQIQEQQQQQQPSAATLFPERLLALLSNGWTALRNIALALLVRCSRIRQETHILSSAAPSLSFLVPCRFETIVSRDENKQQEALTNACKLIATASTLRSSSYGAAILQLSCEMAAVGSTTRASSSYRVGFGAGTSFVLSSSSQLLFHDFAVFINSEAQRVFEASQSKTTDLAATPLHGFLACIGFAVPLALKYSSSLTVVASPLQQLFDRALSLCIGALNVAAAFVGSHSNDVATEEEGGGRKIDCRGHIIADATSSSSHGGDDAGNIHIAKHSRRIVNNAWLAVCIGTQTIEKLISCSKLYSTKNNNSKSGISAAASCIPQLSPGLAQELGRTLLRILLNSKHNGVISKSRGCLRHLAFGLFRVQGDGRSEQELRSIPAGMMQQLLESDVGVKSGSSQRMLRRSQGLPHAIAPILEAEDHSVPAVLLARAMNFLVDTANEATVAGFDESSAKAMEVIAAKEAVVVHGVNALNVLKFVFEDSQLGALARPWVETAFLVALRGFESNDWFLRNSSLMLFTVVAKRALGDQQHREATAFSRTMTTTTASLLDLFSRLPLALPAMAQSLSPVVHRTDESVHRPSVFPILFVLSMLQSMKSTDMATLLLNNNNKVNNSSNNNNNGVAHVLAILADSVSSCLLSASLPARASASQALLAVTDPSEGKHLLDALAKATTTASGSKKLKSWDSVYGVAALGTATTTQKTPLTAQCLAALDAISTLLLEHCFANRSRAPSGVWSVVFNMVAAVKHKCMSSSASSALATNSDAVAETGSGDALLRKCIRLVVHDIILAPPAEEVQAAAEFHRTSADELYDNICLAASAVPREITNIAQEIQRFTNNISNNNSSNSLAIGSPPWRLATAAVKCATRNVAEKGGFAATPSTATVSSLVALLFKPLLERTTGAGSGGTDGALQLWERIHASRCMSICLEWLAVCPAAASGGGDASAADLNDSSASSSAELTSLVAAVLRDKSAAVICGEAQFPPPLVLCSMFYFWAQNYVKQQQQQQPRLPLSLAAAPVAQLEKLALASQTADFRMTAARCVSHLLSNYHHPQQALDVESWRVLNTLLALAVKLCFDDDPIIRRVATNAANSIQRGGGVRGGGGWTGTTCHISTVQALVALWKKESCAQQQQQQQPGVQTAASATELMKQTMEKIAAFSQPNDDREVAVERRTGGSDDEDEDDELNNEDDDEEEEDLFKKDEDNAFAEAGLLREVLF